ncbi:MAG: hypothetical protein HC786_27725 [Richelia sp. CSU_2_1]|nr:hypothetical protein [Microcoleus sp. SU_5_6]NJL69525.1 hypothetical protein [Microcoleus sp. SM1_3_4]NJR25656.1 hypothetical protein [Richelia sp. CSU_2_1]
MKTKEVRQRMQVADVADVTDVWKKKEAGSKKKVNVFSLSVSHSAPSASSAVNKKIN